MEAVDMFLVAAILSLATCCIYILLQRSARSSEADGRKLGGSGTTLIPGNTMDSPPDVTVLGRSAWTLIHTMAVRYPESPSAEDKKKMLQFLSALSEFYPCPLCAAHLRQYLSAHPADVSSKSALRQWLCDLHNNVNQRLKKPTFNCELVGDRWGGGPLLGSSGKSKPIDLEKQTLGTGTGCGSGFCSRR